MNYYWLLCNFWTQLLPKIPQRWENIAEVKAVWKKWHSPSFGRFGWLYSTLRNPGAFHRCSSDHWLVSPKSRLQSEKEFNMGLSYSGETIFKTVDIWNEFQKVKNKYAGCVLLSPCVRVVSKVSSASDVLHRINGQLVRFLFSNAP